MWIICCHDAKKETVIQLVDNVATLVGASQSVSPMRELVSVNMLSLIIIDFMEFDRQREEALDRVIGLCVECVAQIATCG